MADFCLINFTWIKHGEKVMKEEKIKVYLFTLEHVNSTAHSANIGAIILFTLLFIFSAYNVVKLVTWAIRWPSYSFKSADSTFMSKIEVLLIAVSRSHEVKLYFTFVLVPAGPFLQPFLPPNICDVGSPRLPLLLCLLCGPS